MFFGKYKGYALANVPADYLLWIYKNLRLREDLKKYIDDNKKGLEQEVRLNAKNIRR